MEAFSSRHTYTILIYELDIISAQVSSLTLVYNFISSLFLYFNMKNSPHLPKPIKGIKVTLDNLCKNIESLHKL
jgi:hypothetical protein